MDLLDGIAGGLIGALVMLMATRIKARAQIRVAMMSAEKERTAWVERHVIDERFDPVLGWLRTFVTERSRYGEGPTEEILEHVESLEQILGIRHRSWMQRISTLDPSQCQTDADSDRVFASAKGLRTEINYYRTQYVLHPIPGPWRLALWKGVFWWRSLRAQSPGNAVLEAPEPVETPPGSAAVPASANEPVLNEAPAIVADGENPS